MWGCVCVCVGGVIEWGGGGGGCYYYDMMHVECMNVLECIYCHNIVYALFLIDLIIAFRLIQ